MAVSLPSIDRETIRALHDGDEKALERIFRTDGPALAATARERLGDSNATARLVEHTILRAWDDRLRFEDPVTLQRFLEEELRDGTERERRRRETLHRFEHAEGVRRKPDTPAATAVNLDEAWAHVASNLRTPNGDGAHMEKEQIEVARHHAAANLARATQPRSRTVPIITGVVLVALLVGFFKWMDRKGADVAVTQAFNSGDARNMKSTTGQRADASLSDGSKMTIGPETQATVPPEFGDKWRAIRLDGIASFTIVPGTLPFEVWALNTTIVATGTGFSVRAYKDEGTVTIRVKDGSVEVRGPQGNRTVAAGAALVVQKDGTMSVPSPEALDEALGWADGHVAFTNRPLRDVLPELKRFYSLAAEVPDTALLSRPVTMSASSESKKDAIAALEKSAGVKFGYEGEKPVLRDATKGAKK